MKALTLVGPSQFEIQELPRPELNADEVLIRVRAVGICGSDVHGMDGSTGRRQPPIVMGHEAAGEIEAIGLRVTRWSPGDRVAMDSTVYCGKCNRCARGEVNLCGRRQVLGVSCGDYRRAGAFAEYVSVPQHILYALPDGVSYEQGAMIEPVSIGYHAARRAEIVAGQSACVVGSGMIGLLLIQVLKGLGCGPIIAVDREAGKVEKAIEVGADFACLVEDLNTTVMTVTGGNGAGCGHLRWWAQPRLLTVLSTRLAWAEKSC